MAQAGTARHCGLCDRSVHDLSALTRSEAEALLRAPGRLCVRIQQDRDGRIVMRDATARPRVSLALHRVARVFLGALSLIAAACGAGEQGDVAEVVAPETAEAPARRCPPKRGSQDSDEEAEREQLRQLIGYIE